MKLHVVTALLTAPPTGVGLDANRTKMVILTTQARSQDEARGAGIRRFLELHPGYAISMIAAVEVEQVTTTATTTPAAEASLTACAARINDLENALRPFAEAGNVLSRWLAKDGLHVRDLRESQIIFQQRSNGAHRGSTDLEPSALITANNVLNNRAGR